MTVKQAHSQTETLSKKTLLLMSFACGASVANIYYNQPLLEQMRQSLNGDIESIGWVPTLTQAGYAIGMLFVVPLGDMLERRRLVVIFTLLASVSSAWLAVAGSLRALGLASLFLGLSTMTPQLLIPFAAHLAPAREKGRVVGTMMSGLLLGILLARTVSGFVGAAFGWRFMFAAASVFLFGLSCLLLFALPKSSPSFQGKYFGLLKSVVQIFKEQAVLREASLFGAMLFGSFSAFWATLIHLMEAPQFALDSRAVGWFGLLGAAAALLGPWVGKRVDHADRRKTAGAMIVLTLVSFLVFGFSSASLFGIGIGILLMDLGVQSGHIANQSRIFSLLPGSQSRVQTAYMFCYFSGGALGSSLGAYWFSRAGWTGVCLSASSMLFIALTRFLLPRPKSAGRD